MSLAHPWLAAPPAPTSEALDAADNEIDRPWALRRARITTLLETPADLGDPLPVELALLSVSGGLIETPPSPEHRIFLHVGSPVPTTCGGYGAPKARIAERGDVDIIPAGGGGFWIDEAPALSLKIAIAPSVLDRVADETGRRMAILDPTGPLRDQAIEPIGWALKAELESGGSSGRLYLEGLALALSARLLTRFGEAAQAPFRPEPLGDHRFRHVVDHIEAHLDADLSLARLAAVAGLSPSHFKASFRQAVGAPLHQYVIRRRVERAAELLAKGDRPISEVAFEVGFAHQSHLARWTRRLLGASPAELAARA